MIKFIVNSFECPSGSGWQRKAVNLISVTSGRCVWFNCDIGNISGELLKMGYTWPELQCLQVDVTPAYWRKRFDSGNWTREHELTQEFVFSLSRKNGKVGK